MAPIDCGAIGTGRGNDEPPPLHAASADAHIAKVESMNRRFMTKAILKGRTSQDYYKGLRILAFVCSHPHLAAEPFDLSGGAR